MKRSEPEQYLYEHPNLLDDSFSVSMTEAEQWAKEHPVSASAFIARAKEKHPEIPEEQWADFEKAAAKQEKTACQAPIVYIRWWQVAVAVVILIVLTFTLVPPARAWAESVIRYIVTIFDGGVDITQEGKSFTHGSLLPDVTIPPASGVIDTEMDQHIKTYPDIAAFTEDTGYRPVIAVDLSMKEIKFEWLEDAYAELCVTYESKNGVLIYIWQIWGDERGGTIFKDENDILVHTTVLDGRETVGYVDTVDNHHSLEILLDDSDLMILCHGDVDYQTILDALQYS